MGEDNGVTACNDGLLCGRLSNRAILKDLVFLLRYLSEEQHAQLSALIGG